LQKIARTGTFLPCSELLALSGRPQAAIFPLLTPILVSLAKRQNFFCSNEFFVLRTAAVLRRTNSIWKQKPNFFYT
jgi:hypothetical protein